MAKTLALPLLLWAAHELGTIIPGDLAKRIREQLIHAGVVVDGNPIEKIEIAVRQNGDQLVYRAVGGGATAAAASTAEGGGGGTIDATMNDGGTTAGTLNDVDVILSQN